MKKWVPILLQGITIASIPAVAWLSSVGTIKAYDILKNEELSVKEKFSQSWKYYIPTVAVGTVGVASGIASGVASNRIQTALAGTAMAIDHALREKQDYINTLATKGDIEIEPDYVEPNSNAWFLEPISGRSFWSTVDQIQARIDDFTEWFICNKFATVDDYHAFLALSPAELEMDDRTVVRFFEDLAWDLKEIQLDYAIDHPGIYIEKTEQENHYILKMLVPPERLFA